MAKPMTVAEFLSKAIELSGKTQREVAREAGYDKPNVLSMMKQGVTKVPIERIPALSKACGVDVAQFLRIAMNEYMPDTWAVIRKHTGDLLTEDERTMLEAYRESRQSEPQIEQLTRRELQRRLKQKDVME